jgi:hypothetical protein
MSPPHSIAFRPFSSHAEIIPSGESLRNVMEQSPDWITLVSPLFLGRNARISQVGRGKLWHSLIKCAPEIFQK